MAAGLTLEIGDEATNSGRRYLRLLTLELHAACIEGEEPQRARELLMEAAAERDEIGAVPWPFEPCREIARMRAERSDA